MKPQNLTVVILLCAHFLATTCFAENKIHLKVVMSDDSPPTSYIENGKAAGMFYEITEALFKRLPKYKISFTALPWKRAQFELQQGAMDVFLTFPTEGRKKYAEFALEPLYEWDYGNLVFNKNNPKRSVIDKAAKFEDLKELTFLSQEGVDWENENVPPFIRRVFSKNIASMLHLVLGRGSGDFFIMSPEQAIFYANKHGYLDKMDMKKVTFISNDKVRFHFGVRKSFVGKESLIKAVEATMKNPEFINESTAIKTKYTSSFKEKNQK